MTGIDIITIEEITVLLLLIASAVAVLARRLRLPYTVGLVLMGLVESYCDSHIASNHSGIACAPIDLRGCLSLALGRPAS